MSIGENLLGTSPNPRCLQTGVLYLSLSMQPANGKRRNSFCYF